MYRTTINLRKDLSNMELNVAKAIAEQAFNNHTGQIRNSGTTPYQLVFEMEGERGHSILGIGNSNLCMKAKGFDRYVESWPYEDLDNPHENCDILQVFSNMSIL